MASTAGSFSSKRQRIRLIVLGLSSLVALLLVPAYAAAAPVTVTLSGTGSGKVTSTQVGEGGKSINCSNLGNPGGPGTGTCSETFKGGTKVQLTATAAVHPALFQGWTGTNAEACNSGTTNPCEFTSAGVLTATVNAAFRAPPNPPVATTGATSPGPATYLLTLEGIVDPNGEKVESCRFEYGADTEYGLSTACSPSVLEGSGDKAVTGLAELEQLEPSTVYHYRLVASNPGGVSNGSDHTFTTGPAPADGCANAAFRNTQPFGAILFPSCMALEMVSDPRKGSQPAREPIVSAVGDRVSFSSVAALGGTPGSVDIGGDRYVSSRGGSGWSTASTDQMGILKGWASFGGAKSFTPDLSRWFQVGATSVQYQQGIAQAFQGSLGESFEPFSSLLVPVASGESSSIVLETRLKGASADHSHLFFQPGSEGTLGAGLGTAYIPGDPKPVGTGRDLNTYVAHLDSEGNPSLELLARDRLGTIWGGNCGARLGGTPAPGSPVRNQGAVSANGLRAYFSARVGQSTGENCNVATNKLRILERLESNEGTWIGPLFGTECTRLDCSTANGNDLYQGASVDGTRVYFTTNRQLANSDTDGSATECSSSSAVAGCDLYLYDSSLSTGHRLIQVSAGEVTASHPTVGAGANVLDGTVGISGDGSHVYYVAEGALTGENAEHKSPSTAAGARNLYLYERDGAHPNGQTVFVATLSSSDAGGLWGGNGSWQNRAYPAPVSGQNSSGTEVGGDGHLLLFQSAAPLTANDTDGSRLDDFRYDAGTGQVECVSCRPGGPDSEPFDVAARSIPGELSNLELGTDFAEVGRWASENGQTVVFKTVEGMVPGDVNGLMDSYLWREGQLFRLPGTSDKPNAVGSLPLSDKPVLSHDGSEVAFQSFARLLPQDGDSAIDIYVARTGGGYPNPQPVPICDPDTNCKPPPTPPPAAPSSASEKPSEGNPPKAKPAGCPKGKRKVHQHGKARCVPKHKHSSKKRGGKAHRTRHVNTNRRAAK